MPARVNYDRFIASANRMIGKAGSARTLVRRTTSGDPAKPQIVEVQHSCIGVEFDIETKFVDGKTILLGDKMAYVAPSLTVAALAGDKYIDKEGVSYRIYKVDKIAPDGKVVLWTYWMRK